MKISYEISGYIYPDLVKPWARVVTTLATDVQGAFKFGNNWLKLDAENENRRKGDFHLDSKAHMIGKSIVFGFRYLNEDRHAKGLLAFGKMSKKTSASNYTNRVLSLTLAGNMSEILFADDDEMDKIPYFAREKQIGEILAKDVLDTTREFAGGDLALQRPTAADWVAAYMKVTSGVRATTATHKLKAKAEMYTKKETGWDNMTIITQQLVPAQIVTIDNIDYHLPKNIYALQNMRGIILFGIVKNGKQSIGLATDLIDMQDVMMNPQMAELVRLQARTLKSEVSTMEIAARAIELKSAGNGKP